MNILLRTTYPSSELYKAIDVFTSKELPKRPDYVKEVASFTHSTAAGYEVFFIFEVPDARISEYLKAQTERSAHMQTRIAHFNIEVHVGMSVPDAIQAVASQRPR